MATKGRHQPTDKQRGEVEAYAIMGVPQTTIAKMIGIDAKTLRARYREELDRGTAKGDVGLLKTAYGAAMKGDKTMLIFLMKVRPGIAYTERQYLQVEDNTNPNRRMNYAERLEAEKAAILNGAATASVGATVQ